ncbi:MAG: preprotein translocase subunit SecG [Gemmatimonadota bacterium]
MIAFLMVLFLLVCFGLVVCVLLQSGKGGGLAAGFGGSGTGFELLGGRQTATFLHQATRWLGGAFLALAFLIAILTARGNRPGSLIEREFQGQPQPVEEAVSPADLESVVGQPPAEGDGAPAVTGAPAGAADADPPPGGEPAAETGAPAAP